MSNDQRRGSGDSQPQTSTGTGRPKVSSQPAQPSESLRRKVKFSKTDSSPDGLFTLKYVTNIDVVSPGRRPGSTVNDAKPYGCTRSRTPIHTASSLANVDTRLPVVGSAVAETEVMTFAVPSVKKLWLVVPDTPPPPRIMCTVPWVESMT